RDDIADAVLAHASGKPSGTFELVDGSGNDARIVSYRPVPERPLVIAVTVDTGVLLQGWRAERRDYLFIFGLLFAALGSLTWGFVRLLQRRQDHLLQLSRNETKLEQQSALLQSTLEHMGEGLSVFDRDHRLLAWNDRFIALLGLPSGVGLGTRMEDIL